jgi:hypothetical protein
MQAHKSPLDHSGMYTPKFTSPIVLPSVPSSPESKSMKSSRSPAFSQGPLLGALEQLQRYEECISKVSSEIAISRDECVALQERLCISDSELHKKAHTIGQLFAENQQLSRELHEKNAAIEDLTSQIVQERADMKTTADVPLPKPIDGQNEQAMLDRDALMIALTASNEEKDSLIMQMEKNISDLKRSQQDHFSIQIDVQQSHRNEILRLQDALQASENAVIDLQKTLQEEQLLTQVLKEDQKAHIAIQDARQSERSEILRLQDALQASENAVIDLQKTLQEEQLLAQVLKEYQKAHIAIQDARQSERSEILRLQDELQASESNCDSLRFALQEERLLNQKFGKVEHLLSANSTISVASQSFVLAELEVEKKLSERLKAALEESTQINSRMLHANSAYQEKVEELQARVISCNSCLPVPFCLIIL